MVEAEELGEIGEEAERTAGDEEGRAAPCEEPAPPGPFPFQFRQVRTGYPAAPSLRPE